MSKRLGRYPNSPARRVGAAPSGRVLSLAERSIALAPGNLIQYLILNETSGSPAVDYSGNGRNGAHAAAVTLGATTGPDGNPAPQYGGAGATNLHSASLASAFNGNAGTLALWLRVLNVGVWSDGQFTRPAMVQANGTNRVMFQKSSTANTMTLHYMAGGTDRLVTITISTTLWFHLAITWDKAANSGSGEVRGYLNGVLQGAPSSIPGTWSGSLSSGNTAIGAIDPSGSAARWNGYLAHCGLWNIALPAASILSLATPA